MQTLENGAEVKRGDSWVTASFEGILFGCLGTIPHFSYPLPDCTDTVVKIVFK